MKPARKPLSTLGLVLLLTQLSIGAKATAQVETQPESQGQQRVTILRGRILADLALQFHGAGLGPKYQTFIFGVEQNDGHIQPVKISYVYFGRSGLASGLFDYTKRFELRAVREKRCDDSVEHLSWVKNSDSSGRELPPTYVLRLLDGVPDALIKPEMNLPCYFVGEGHLRLVPAE